MYVWGDLTSTLMRAGTQCGMHNAYINYYTLQFEYVCAQACALLRVNELYVRVRAWTRVTFMYAVLTEQGLMSFIQGLFILYSPSQYVLYSGFFANVLYSGFFLEIRVSIAIWENFIH